MTYRNAMTLVELLVVLGILIALGGALVPLCNDNLNSAAESVTQATLAEAKDAMLTYWSDTKFVPLDGVTSVAVEADRFEIEWLFANPVTGNGTVSFDANSRRGWNGPYVATSTADAIAAGGPNLVDGWNQTLVVQYVNPNASLKDVRIVSKGANGLLDIPAATATSALTNNSIGDDLYVALSLR